MNRPSIRGAALLRATTTVACFAALSIAISWPLARDFTTALTGSGLDAMSHLWGVWHTGQALLGREPFFSTSLLFYPAGISLLLHSAGPIPGVLAFPFWPLGPVAAYNGGLVVGLTLTGYAMYLLARELGCSRASSLCAGVILLCAPEHLVGLRGHLANVFLGLIPIAFITLRRAHDPRRSRAWCAAFGGVSLLLLLHSSSQFIQVALCAPLVTIAALAIGTDRRTVLARAAWTALAAACIAGPLLAAIASAASDPAMTIDRRTESIEHQPDALQFIVPPTFSRVFGGWSVATLSRFGIDPQVETEVAIPIAAIVLAIVALWKTPRDSAVWIATAGFAIALSCGPTLRAGGVDTGFSMPYTWISALPGLDFLRTPARFMQIANVAVAAAAALGFGTIVRSGRRASIAAAVVIGAVLIEVWPHAWPTLALPRVPGLYAALARDGEQYGVLDLPIRPSPELSPFDYSARYQVLQMTHGKGIAGGYISRAYERHPIAPCIYDVQRTQADVRVNGTPSPCEPAAIYQLATHGYRYLVWHLPWDQTRDNSPGSFADRDAAAFAAAAFEGRPADITDDVIKAWRIPPGDQALPATPVLEVTSGWYPGETQWRWAQSPASVRITSARAMRAELAIDVAFVHGLESTVGLGPEGVLIVTTGADPISVAVKPDETVRIPISVAAGVTNVTLALGAGNFRPADYGGDDARVLSFAIRAIDLVTSR